MSLRAHAQYLRLYLIMSLKFQKRFPRHEFLALHENYARQWKILHNRLYSQQVTQ